MGVCVSKEKKNKSFNYSTRSQLNLQNFMITQDKQNTILYHSIKIQAEVQPKEYDYTMVFAVVNSIERSFDDEPINNDK
ncbi:unnamed protein product [Paramecium pentaurelia]|uniref:Uncharacterized protein n=1 Tax=Paramecium pentaurelia TaxID=43138 RepID=A0A8S1TZB2_9CILI|nr:unnamed protein product [Paramecium pentaurelia]